eukprot:CAMPEP_0179950400 /NCGR_PEP_ID=MMETSP0983-20121128/22913_1 /TAXON_ID=483367 /ORGANISM="non described non described, Strain CCMP 2436" /LENGTH=210 /DNA_ID=CAMNT_0021860333 /DNA_START=68 /DNA_END=701 /DNA_ORIENTATION=+
MISNSMRSPAEGPQSGPAGTVCSGCRRLSTQIKAALTDSRPKAAAQSAVAGHWANGRLAAAVGSHSFKSREHKRSRPMGRDARVGASRAPSGAIGERHSAEYVACRRVDRLTVDEPGLWVRATRPAEEQDVRLRLVDAVMHPSAALLHAETAPLVLQQQLALGHLLRHVLGQNHVPVLKVVIAVLVGILDVARHPEIRVGGSSGGRGTSV